MIDKNEIIKNSINVRQQSWFNFIKYWIIDSRTRESIRVNNFLKLQFTKERQELLNQIIKQNNFDKIKNYDERVIAILRWVKNNLTYVSDRIQYNTVEKWDFVDEILTYWYVWKDRFRRELILVGKGMEKPHKDAFRADDCEGGATLIWALAVQSGVPSDRIYLFAGDVVGGGHAWVGYISENYPYVFFFLDWCYWYDSKHIKYRKAYLIDKKDKTKILGDKKYKTLWFFTNESNTYRGKK